ncbi:hypothetical protein V2G26_008260 [Clonostachys chloroleuca]
MRGCVMSSKEHGFKENENKNNIGSERVSAEGQRCGTPGAYYSTNGIFFVVCTLLLSHSRWLSGSWHAPTGTRYQINAQLSALLPFTGAHGVCQGDLGKSP